MQKKVILAILDWFGLTENNPSENAILQANAPTIHGLLKKPYAKLDASGTSVWIPEWQMGNSEVGHITIGAGRAVLQGTMRIDASLDDGSFSELPEFQETFSHLQASYGKLHIMWLFGPGGVHASQAHLEKILPIIPKATTVYLHLFTDGRDLAPNSALEILKDFQNNTLSKYENIHLASIAGRYFAMDRDNNYSRLEKAYNATTWNLGASNMSAEQYLETAYKNATTDEFIEPTLLTEMGKISSGDAVWFLNFRSDRARMMCEAFVEKDFSHFQRTGLQNLFFVSMVPYYKEYSGKAFFRDEALQNTLWEVLSRAWIKQLRIAETEKFAHVTKFFNGGKFEPFDGETQKLIPSHKVATYDLDPAMSADEITDTILSEGTNYPVIIVNYANGDMVGHTGSIQAAIQAVETLDRNVKQLIAFAKENGYEILLTADHGNCEEMGSAKEPKTSHTTNYVPCWHIVNGKAIKLNKDTGTLANLAPSVLTILGINAPEVMLPSLISCK